MDSFGLEQKIENFLTNIIKVKNWRIEKENPSPSKKLDLLRKIVKCHINEVYFHNIPMAAADIEKRHAPTLEEIIEVGSNGNGGVCIQLNYFLKLILDYLGYDNFLIAASVHALNNHCCIVVRFSEKEMYLVDVACGSPSDEPIPLHQLPHRTIAAGYPFEYRLSDEGIYQRVQLGGSYTKGDFPETKEEEIRYTFTLEPKSLSTFDSPMHEVFTDSASSIFLQAPFAFRHFRNENVPEETDFNFILVFGSTVVIAGRDIRQVKKFASFEEIVPVLNEYFPKLIPSEIEKAIKVWNQYAKENQGSENEG